jgi:cellulose synthase (UDP-forming)
MMPTGFHIPLMLLVVGGCLLLAAVSNSRHQPSRAAMCLLAGAAGLVYLDWRLGHTGVGLIATLAAPRSIWLWMFLAVEVFALVELSIFMLTMSRFRDNRPAAEAGERRLRALPAEQLPEIDVWIATYDESWQILEKTIVGALHLDYPKDKLRIWVLDDQRRGWLAERCAELGVNHVTRPDNAGRKAGNHNHALGRTSAPFILSLDADFVPFPNFLYRTLGLFDDPRVAIVQTPQTFYNVDVVRSGLGLQRTAPDELAFFYREILPARDGWDAAFYCGTCALLRRSALLEVGGFVTETEVEDQATSVKLLAAGYCTRYLDEPLSVGLSAESTDTLHDQRRRWCRGSIQIAYLPFGPFGRGLSAPQRLMFSMTSWLANAVCPIAYSLAPALLWGLGWKIYPAANATEIMVMPFGLLTAVATGLGWLSRLHWSPLINPATELFHAVELAPAAISSFLKPFGKPLIRIRPVTAKGDAAVPRRVDWQTFLVLSAILALNLGAFGHALVVAGPRIDQFNEVTACVAWTFYILWTLAVALFICFERPYRRAEERFEVQRSSTMAAGGLVLPVLIRDVSLDGARLRLDTPARLRHGQEVRLTVPQIGAVDCTVARLGDDGVELGLRFAAMEREVRHRLICTIFTSPAVQTPPESFAALPMLTGLVRRFLRTV